MNKVILIGRLCAEPSVHHTASDISVSSFTLAVDRKFKNSDGDKMTDFISIVAWKNLSDFVQKFVNKGMKLVVIGSMHIRNYEKDDGTKVYITEVIAEEIEFAESKISKERSKVLT